MTQSTRLLPLTRNDRAVCVNLKSVATSVADSIDEYVHDNNLQLREQTNLLKATSTLRIGGRHLEPFTHGVPPLDFSMSKALRRDVHNDAFYMKEFGADIDAAIRMLSKNKSAFHEYWATARGNSVYANTVTTKLLVLASPVALETTTFRSFGHFYDVLYAIARKLA